MQEIWKDVPEWEDAYSISNTGRIFSKRMKKPITLRISNHGYVTADLFTRRQGIIRRKKVYVHRLVAMCFVPNPDNKDYVDHIDNNKTNNLYTNLQWVTNSENVKKGYLTADPEKKKKHFRKQAVFINTTPKIYFESMRECAKSLGLPAERIKTVLRFFNGNLPELNIQICRCESND